MQAPSWRHLVAPRSHVGALTYEQLLSFYHRTLGGKVNDLYVNLCHDGTLRLSWGLAVAEVAPTGLYCLDWSVGKPLAQVRRAFRPLFGFAPSLSVEYGGSESWGLGVCLQGYRRLLYDSTGICLRSPCWWGERYTFKQLAAAVLLVFLRWCRSAGRDPQQLQGVSFEYRRLWGRYPGRELKLQGTTGSKLLRAQLLRLLRDFGVDEKLEDVDAQGAKLSFRLPALRFEQEEQLADVAGEPGRPSTLWLPTSTACGWLQPPLKCPLQYEQLCSWRRRRRLTRHLHLQALAGGAMRLYHASAARGYVPVLDVHADRTYTLWDMRSPWALSVVKEALGNCPRYAAYPALWSPYIRTYCSFYEGMRIDEGWQLLNGPRLWQPELSLSQIELDLLRRLYDRYASTRTAISCDVWFESEDEDEGPYVALGNEGDPGPDLGELLAEWAWQVGVIPAVRRCGQRLRLVLRLDLSSAHACIQVQNVLYSSS
jgi:hypothetical protein